MKKKFILNNKLLYRIRIDKYLNFFFPNYSRNFFQKLIKNNNIIVNNKFIKKSIKLKGFEKIQITLKNIFFKKKCFLQQNIFFQSIYEDNEILLINKPTNLVIHPGYNNWTKTLFNGLLYKYPKLINIPRMGIIHRLDKNTSGVLIIAKTLLTYYNLINQFKKHIVKKYYLAIVWGIINIKGKIKQPIIRNPKNKKKMITLNIIKSKKSITYYKRLAIGKIKNLDVSLIYCKIKTGRTHQIRVHMKFLGFPLVGDNLYNKNNYLLSIIKYQALIAKKIVFIHPKNKEKIILSLNISSYFLKLLKIFNIKYVI